MKKAVALLLFVSLFAACSNPIKPSEITKINGYWEIEKVVLPDGSEKDYAINDTYDYFEIKDNEGFRKKAIPQFNGTFLTNDVSEKVKVVFENQKPYLEYTTDYSKWKEELLEITDLVMVLRNTQKNEYHYKKAGVLNLTGDGKKTP